MKYDAQHVSRREKKERKKIKTSGNYDIFKRCSDAGGG